MTLPERFRVKGETKIGKKLPVNPSSGFFSHGEVLSAQALWQVIECANQLRERCGERQVPDAKVALAQTYGLMGNSATTIMTIHVATGRRSHVR